MMNAYLKTGFRIFLIVMVLAIFNACDKHETTQTPSTTPTTTTPTSPTTTPTPPAQPETSSGVTLHLIIVADTLDPNIGKSVIRDSENIQSMFQSVVNSSQRKISLNKIVLEGSSITRHNLMTALTYPRIKSNDIVVFLYSGHGFRTSDKSSKWPMLNTKEYSTNFDEVISIIKSANPRMFILIADCCNNYIDRGIRTIAPKMLDTFEYKNIERMFLSSNTKIAASGSVPGMYSYGDDDEGGYFTAAFISSLKTALNSSDGNWDKVFTEAVSKVSQRTQGNQKPQYEEIR